MSDEWSKDLQERAKNLGIVPTMAQSDIDDIFSTPAPVAKKKTGIELLVNNSNINYDRLPMLEIVFDRFSRTNTTTLRNLLNDNVEVNLQHIQTKRFGQFKDGIPLPCIMVVVKAVEWDNYIILVIDPHLVYSLVDVLLGGRRGVSPMNIDGRGFSTLEKTLIERVVKNILEDLSNSFAPIANITFLYDRLETNPRFCEITRPQNAVLEAKLRIEMENRGGHLTMMIPYATLEPIREELLQQFMGEKFGRDSIWETHLKTELMNTDISLTAIMASRKSTLGQVMQWKVGSELMLDVSPKDSIVVNCGERPMFMGKMGRSKSNIAIKLDTIVKKG